MAFRLPLLIIGIVGFGVFLITGLSGVIPWVASGLFAGAFLTLIVIAQVVEYFRTSIDPETDNSEGTDDSEDIDDEDNDEDNYDDDTDE